MEYKVIYYYVEYKEIYYIEDSDDSNELKTLSFLKINKPENKFHSFRMFEDYTRCQQDLIRFKTNFTNWVEEIKTVPLKTKSKKYYRLDYKSFFNHNGAVFHFFKSKNKNEDLDQFEPVSQDEFLIFERCYNAGLICLNLEYKKQPTQCYGYDFSRYYTHLLKSMRIPKSQGIKKDLDSVEFGKLDFGIYRVKIEYTNKALTNIFNFNSDNHYTSSVLNYLESIKDIYGIKLTLLKTDSDYNYNALVYDEKDLIKGEKLFKDWFKALESIREQFPENRLVKHLMSSLWGTLTSFNKVYTEDLSEYDATYLDDLEESEHKIIKHKDNHYVLVKASNAFNHSLARIKPFLTAFGRLKLMKLIIEQNLDKDIVRLHTDGLVFNKPVDFESMGLSYYPKPENKTTGLIKYHNAVYGFHICPNCGCEFRYKDFKNHKC